MERSGSKDQSRDIKISLPGYELTISPTDQPRGLISTRSRDFQQREAVPVPKTGKSVRMEPGEMEILKILASHVFSEETGGVGQAEFWVPQELAVKRSSKESGTLVGPEDFRKVILAIKGRSPKLAPRDVAAVVLHTVPELRQLTHEQPEYVGALIRLSSAIKEYWSPVEIKRKPTKRK